MDDIIYLDLDGVCVQWTESALKLLGQRELPPAPEKVPYNIETWLGIPLEEMWGKIHAAGVEWWAALPPYPFFRDLYDSLCAIGPEVVILTAQCRSGNSAAGKVQWLNKHIGGSIYEKCVLTVRKELLARPNAVLVDDKEANIHAFERHGGRGVLFPRQWNTAPHVDDADVVRHVVERVRSAFLSNG